MKATIHLLPSDLRRSFVFLEENRVPAMIAHYKEGVFTKSKEIAVIGKKSAEAVAEEMFDLTNNPSHQDERELVYGNGRSVSVGDIVEVEGDDPEKTESWLCMSFGWQRII